MAKKKSADPRERSHKPSTWTQAEREAAKAFHGIKKSQSIPRSADSGRVLSSSKKETIKKAVKDHYRG